MKSAPRARGDGPLPICGARGANACSPRTRGWSPRHRAVPIAAGLLPAHAGMVRPRSRGWRRRAAAPRARGDGPGWTTCLGGWNGCSPRTRGWSSRQAAVEDERVLLPAHAGMVRPASTSTCMPTAAPRARGDGPLDQLHGPTEGTCSPRTRGWSAEHGTHWNPVVCSPRTRGWSWLRETVDLYKTLLPAHAGMVPAGIRRAQVRLTAPRARGDGPSSRDSAGSMSACSPRTRGWSTLLTDRAVDKGLLPAHAGMVRSCGSSRTTVRTAPRARGDGPDRRGQRHRAGNCSPRTRGWSSAHTCAAVCRNLLPAHAGMVRRNVAAIAQRVAAPRARGDGPIPDAGAGVWLDCSPRTRGWSQHQPQDGVGNCLLPAHAGMVRGRCGRSPTSAAAPRARGDGPALVSAIACPNVCSPRTRGWSVGDRVGVGGVGLLPAHAGMVLPSAAATALTSAAPRARGDGPDASGSSGDTHSLLPAHAGMVLRLRTSFA